MSDAYPDADAPVVERTTEDVHRMNEALIEQGWRDEKRIRGMSTEIERLNGELERALHRGSFRAIKVELHQMTEQRDYQMERARLANVRADAIDGMRRYWKGRALKTERITEPTEGADNA